VDFPVPGDRPARTGIDVWLSRNRDLAAARSFFSQAPALGTVPVEVTTDRALAYPRILDEFVPGARHVTEQYANNTVETDHGGTVAMSHPATEAPQD
jgi:IS6 family transposase